MKIDEPGVLPKSEIHIFDPSGVAASSLIHILFWGDYQCLPPYQIVRENYDSLLILLSTAANSNWLTQVRRLSWHQAASG